MITWCQILQWPKRRPNQDKSSWAEKEFKIHWYMWFLLPKHWKQTWKAQFFVEKKLITMWPDKEPATMLWSVSLPAFTHVTFLRREEMDQTKEFDWLFRREALGFLCRHRSYPCLFLQGMFKNQKCSLWRVEIFTNKVTNLTRCHTHASWTKELYCKLTSKYFCYFFISLTL